MKFFLFSFLLLVQCYLFSQDQALVDSLNNEIKKAAHDSIRIRLLNELSAYYLFTNTTGAGKPAREALELSEKTKDTKGKMDAFMRLGIMCYRMGEYDSSVTFYRKGMAIAETKKDTSYILKYRANIALTLSNQGKYKESLDMYLKIIDLQRKYNPKTVCKNLLDMASIYYHLEDYKNAFETAVEAKNLAERYNDQATLSNAYGSMGVFISELGKNDEALRYHKRSLEIKKQIGDKVGQLNTLINITIILKSRQEYARALAINDSIIILGNEIGAVKQVADAWSNGGTINTDMGQFEKANKSFLQAYKLYTGLASLKDLVLITVKLGCNYERLKDYKRSSYFFQESLKLTDSLYKVNMADEMAEMRTKFNTEKKEQENLRLAKENELQLFKLESEKQMRYTQLWMAVVGGFLLICIFVLVIFRYRAKKKTEMERQVVLQKNLGLKAVIEAEEKERIRIAKDLHDGLGQMLSTARVNMAALEGEVSKEDEKLLDNALRTIDESINEVRNISHNMMPVALIEYGLIKAVDVLVMRVNEAKVMKIIFNHKGLGRLEQSVEISIYRIIQEVLNNMIKHSDAKNILINLQKSDYKILLKINDDGKGFDPGDIGKSSGIGWKNIYSRLSVINGNMDVHSDPGTGTVINIDFTI